MSCKITTAERVSVTCIWKDILGPFFVYVSLRGVSRFQIIHKGHNRNVYRIAQIFYYNKDIMMDVVGDRDVWFFSP